MQPIQISLLLVALFLEVSCSRQRPEQGSKTPVAAPVRVSSSEAAVAIWPAVYEATGTVRARVTATISSRVPAYVDRVAVQQGDRVAQNQVLITLDSRDLEANVRRADAGYSEVASAVPEIESGIAAAQANLDLAEVTFKRTEELAAKRSVSSQEFDEASAKVKAARANYDMARAKRAQVQAKLEQMLQERSAAAVTRDFARLTAPFAGIVTARSVESGNLAIPGTPLLTIEKAGGYRLEVAVDESRIGAIRSGSSVDMSVEAGDCSGLGRVAEIVPAVDAASRSYLVKIDLPAQHACQALRSGMFGRASFTLGNRKLIVIPAMALIERGQLQSVFVADGGVARVRMVTAGQRMPGKIEILSGLSEGERIVTPVPASLSDGAALEIQP